MERSAYAPLHFVGLWRIVRIATGAAARIVAPLQDLRSLGARQVQVLDTHLSFFRNDGHALDHACLRLLNDPRVELLGDMVEYVSYGRGEVCMLKELAHLAQVPACPEIKQGGRGRPDVGQTER